jgi:hypothetical protein
MTAGNKIVSRNPARKYSSTNTGSDPIVELFFKVRSGKMRAFDLIEFQRDARGRKKPGELFALWEEVCRQYDSGRIGRYELEEMKAVIWPNLRSLTALMREIDSSFIQSRTAA